MYICFSTSNVPALKVRKVEFQLPCSSRRPTVTALANKSFEELFGPTISSDISTEKSHVLASPK